MESDEIRGFAENNNLALRQVTGEYVLCINDDTRIFMRTVDILVNNFAKLPEKAAILSPKIDFPSGETQTCGRPKQTAWKYILERLHLDGSDQKDDTAGKKPVTYSIFQTSDINGACFLIRRDIFEELGWFDERYFFTPEDIALSTKAREKGYGVYVDMDALVIHYHHKTARKVITATKPAGFPDVPQQGKWFALFSARMHRLVYRVSQMVLGQSEMPVEFQKGPARPADRLCP